MIRFWNWLFRPVFESLRDQTTALEVRIDASQEEQMRRLGAITEAIGKLPTPPTPPPLTGVCTSLDGIIGKLDDFQRLSSGFLVAWNAERSDLKDEQLRLTKVITGRLESLPVPPSLNGVCASLDGIHGKLDGLSVDFPRLSFGVLMAWEAVTYAAEKWDRDPLKPELREAEVFRWAGLFLKENRWPNPGQPSLESLLILRDRLKARQLV